MDAGRNGSALRCRARQERFGGLRGGAPSVRRETPVDAASPAVGRLVRVPNLVVIGYDGSGIAGRAIVVAARVLRAERAVVVNVWYQTALTLGPVPAGGPPVLPAPGIEAEFGRVAQEIAGDGAELARREGLIASAEARMAAGHAAIPHALVDVAEDHDADLVVIGRDSQSRVGEAVLGSVSSGALRDARRPVLVVPALESG